MGGSEEQLPGGAEVISSEVDDPLEMVMINLFRARTTLMTNALRLGADSPQIAEILEEMGVGFLKNR